MCCSGTWSVIIVPFGCLTGERIWKICEKLIGYLMNLETEQGLTIFSLHFREQRVFNPVQSPAADALL